MEADNSAIFEWDAKTPHADKFAFRENFVCKVYGSRYHQLVGKDPLERFTTIKATIKKYGSGRYDDVICFGLLTESTKN